MVRECCLSMRSFKGMEWKYIDDLYACVGQRKPRCMCFSVIRSEEGG